MPGSRGALDFRELSRGRWQHFHGTRPWIASSGQGETTRPAEESTIKPSNNPSAEASSTANMREGSPSASEIAISHLARCELINKKKKKKKKL